MSPIVRNIRNAAFYAMLPVFLSLIVLLGPLFDIPCYILGVLGLVVVPLTLKLGEPLAQKLFFLLAGGAGLGFGLTLAVFGLLALAGFKPGGDGGGPTVALLIVVFPLLFLIGAAGSIVLLIKARIAEKKNAP
jgi:hypothetical protein